MDMELTYSSLALLAIIFLLYKIIISPSNQKTKKLPPSPPSVPILGHINLLKPGFHRTLQSLAQRYGPIFSLRLGFQRVLVVSSTWAAEECLTKNDVIFADRPKFLIGQHLGYNYTALIWAPYGDHWRNLRRVATITMLSIRRINESGPARKLELRKMISELLENSKGRTQKVDLTAMFNELAKNIVMRLVYGKPWDNNIITPPTTVMTKCDFLPFLRWIGYKGMEKEMIKMKKERDEFLQSLIDECRENRKKGGKLSSDDVGMPTLIEQLIDWQEGDREYYTDEVLKGFIVVMLNAGSDTTARTLEWAMFNLLNHPDILAKARKELDTHVGTGRLVDDLDLQNLSYIRCIVNETLRLFPAAPLLVPHCSSKDCTIGGFHVPKGTVLIVNAWAIQRDPNMWDEPTTFKPERFENKVEGSKYMPFGIGRRSCPGNNVALRLVSLTVATLVQCFDWEAIDSGSVESTENRESRAVSFQAGKSLEAMYRPRSLMEDVLFKI